MKSPFTGGDAALCHEKQSFEFRKDNFEIVYHFYRCKETKRKSLLTFVDGQVGDIVQNGLIARADDAMCAEEFFHAVGCPTCHA